MKKILLAMLLVAAATAIAQTAPAPAPPQQNPAQPQAPQKKEIKDPAEYNAYVGAVQQQDPAAKVSGLEAFLVQYPKSVMNEDALELLMGTYQQTGNQAKVTETANRLLAVNPDNVKGLMLLAYSERSAQKWADAMQHAERSLQALPKMPKPDGVSEADFGKQKAQFAILLNSVAGFSALQVQNYAAAQKYLRAAVEAAPNSVENIYPLALAYLSANPPDYVNGLFFVARAANLITDAKGKADVTKFGRGKYVKYHGAEDGWNEVLAQTATVTLPPPGFTIKQYVPPTPAEQAADLVKTKKVEEMSFAEWQLVLSEGKPEDADKVWATLKGKPLQMGAHIISIDSPSSLKLAGSSDDVDAKRADIELTMAAAIPARQMPKADTDLQFEGTPVSYVAKPFVMTMKEGALLVKAAPKKPPVHRKPAAH